MVNVLAKFLFRVHVCRSLLIVNNNNKLCLEQQTKCRKILKQSVKTSMLDSMQAGKHKSIPETQNMFVLRVSC